jgi:hypothetical protein
MCPDSESFNVTGEIFAGLRTETGGFPPTWERSNPSAWARSLVSIVAVSGYRYCSGLYWRRQIEIMYHRCGSKIGSRSRLKQRNHGQFASL